NLIMNSINCIGITIRWHNWPIGGIVRQRVLDFFAYTDFSYSWISNNFLLVLNIVVFVLMITVIIGVIFVTLFTNQGSSVLPGITKLVNLCIMLWTNLFYIPFVNCLSGHFLCVGVKKENPDPDMVVTLDCTDSTQIVLMIICAVFLILHFIVTGFSRFFLFTHDMKKGDIWTTQSGMFYLFHMIVSTIVIIISIFLRKYPIVTAIIGFLLFSILILYPLLIKPYFYAHGNAFYSLTLAVISICFLMGLLSEIAGNDKKAWVIALLWIFFVFAVISAPIGIYFLSLFLNKRDWAMQPEDEDIPITQQKKENTPHSFNLLDQIQKKQEQQQVKQQDSRLIPMLPMISLTPEQQLVQQSPMQTSSSQRVLSQRPIQFNQLQNQSNTLYIAPPVITDRTERQLRKRKECVYLADDILRNGLKKIGSSSSSLHLTIALFHMSFTKNHMRAGDAIRSTKQCIPNVIERWMCYSLV
ncbi:MAG: hypothetical protein EZS28_037625, partial [Streblomastix strix]